MKIHRVIAAVLMLITAPFLVHGQKSSKKDSNKEATKTVQLASVTDSISYAIGVSISKNLKTQGVDSLDMESLNSGMLDVSFQRPMLMTPEFANQYLNTYFSGLQSKQGDKKKMAGAAFLAENKTKPGVKTTESGLQYSVITEGTGEIPKATDKVKTHYHGTLIDGTVFDSSVQRGEPVSFPVNGVIKGWTEALQMMKVGSKWRLVIPYDLAYGEQGAGGVIEPFETLIFEVELLSIEK